MLFRSQQRCFCNQNKIEISTIELQASLWGRHTGRIITGFLAICSLLVKSITKKILVGYTLGKRISGELKGVRRYYVIRTWLDDRFLKNTPDYKDSYFGRLPEYAKGQGHNILMLAGISGNYLKILNEIGRAHV